MSNFPEPDGWIPLGGGFFLGLFRRAGVFRRERLYYRVAVDSHQAIMFYGAPGLWARLPFNEDTDISIECCCEVMRASFFASQAGLSLDGYEKFQEKLREGR